MSFFFGLFAALLCGLMIAGMLSLPHPTAWQTVWGCVCVAGEAWGSLFFTLLAVKEMK